MSEGTMTVTAVAPTGESFEYNFTDMGNYFNAGDSWNAVVADALELQAQIFSMEDGSFTKGILAGWLRSNAQGRANIPTILKRYAQMETVRFDTPNTPYYAIEHSNTWQNKTPGNQFTANAFSPFLGLWHYISGNGTEMRLNLPDIGLTFDSSTLTPLDTALKNYAPGDYNISAQFGKRVADDNLFVAALLGRISMLTEGQLRISESGSWTYNGVVRAYDDTYDANFDPSRGVIAQASTTVLSWFNGMPYTIALPGQIDVNLSGQR